MSYLRKASLDTDNGSGDAFGRLRVSDPQTLFDSKQLFDNQALFWDDQEVSGGGTGSTHSSDTASSTLTVGATTAGNRTRQTFQRFNYQPGKSQLILVTFVLDKSGGGAGITRGVGPFDDKNGLFLLDDEGTVKIVRRTYTSGAAVDNEVAQASWNLDAMDGNGPSGITLDWTKTQILVIDFEWLGVGRARIGFNVDGVTYYAHEFLNANNLSEVYISNPNLPIRYEINNDGLGAASSLEAICCSVVSEGGLQDNGALHYMSTEGTHIDCNTANVIYAICAIRLKASHIGTTVKLDQVSLLNQTNDDYEWTLRFNPTVANAVTFSGLANSAVETAVGNAGNPSNSTITGGTIIGGGVHTGGNLGAILTGVENALKLGSAIDGTRDELYLCCRPLSAASNMEGSITWRELS